jgi:hypothetical protein
MDCVICFRRGGIRALQGWCLRTSTEGTPRRWTYDWPVQQFEDGVCSGGRGTASWDIENDKAPVSNQLPADLAQSIIIYIDLRRAVWIVRTDFQYLCAYRTRQGDSLPGVLLRASRDMGAHLEYCSGDYSEYYIKHSASPMDWYSWDSNRDCSGIRGPEDLSDRLCTTTV